MQTRSHRETVAFVIVAASAVAVGTSAPSPATSTASTTTGQLSIQELMDQRVNPAAEFLFRSVREVSDDRGRRLESPKTDADWALVRENIEVLRNAPKALSAPAIRAAPPGFRAENPGVESEPEEIQQALDSNRPDFDRRAQRLATAADALMQAAETKNATAVMKALDGIDKACESCHLRYFYPRDKRAQLQAQKDGVD